MARPTTKFVTLQGQQFTINQLANFAKIKPATMRARINAGYQPDEILRPTNKLHIPTIKFTTA